MAGQVVQYGRHRKRRNYARISEVLELPNLIEIQTKSYDWFLKEGLLEMFRDISPIEDFTGNLSLEFVDYRLGEPKYDLEESKNRDATYAAPLRVKVRLIIKETGEVKEQEVFMGDFPLMTDTGTFVINGAERVIVSQLVRSPSVYFNEKIDKNGRENYDATIIPNRGAWLEYETDAKDVVEIYERLRPGEPPTVENAKSLLYSRFFDPKRYDLASVGRYKANKKLHLKHRLFNQKLAEPIVNSETGEIVVDEGTVLDRRKLDEIMDVLETNANSEVFELEGSVIDEPVEIQSIKVYVPNDEEGRTTTVIGNALPDSEVKCITPADIVASMSYFFNLLNGIGYTDDIDHLGNRRLRSVGELLQNQFRIGLSRMERVVRERMSIQDTDSITPQQLINIRPVIASIKEFFGSSQLSQFMDQANPLAELTHKRRLSALGPGGLTRERAQMEVRDVHYSHYGRMCPIETPEGPNIGLINSLSSYARVNEFGFIETPYRKVDLDTNSITDQIDYLTADEEDSYVVAQANSRLDENGRFLDDEVVCRFRGNNTVMAKEKMDYMDVSPKQVVSAATACIPFLENDDSNRALMGANMQRQA
ncbi:MAG: DNA-directed RNA polymerase subunit beta, partial [Staphylococcus epidermidis]|nr:DNA-directed RNA polymerase subunit beta [Staphylococcus epidermidis]